MTVQDVDNAFRKKAESNVKLYVIRKKIENGTATKTSNTTNHPLYV